jgi:uncharacterized membrane protein
MLLYLSTEMSAGAVEGSPESSLEHLIVIITNYVTFGIDIAAAIVIAISVAVALFGYLKAFSKRRKGGEITKADVVRFRLAGGLLLALDLEVGSDILKTIVVPSTSALISLAVIVALRIVLGWSLSKEISGHSEDILTKK